MERTFKGDSNGVKINIQLPEHVGKMTKRSFPTTGEDQEGTTGDAVNQGSSPTFMAPEAQGTSKKKMAGQTRLTERKKKVHETGCEQRVTSLASFHLNAACFFTKKHETQLKISPGQS